MTIFINNYDTHTFKTIVIYIILFVLVSGCSKYPDNVASVLEKAGNNRRELEKTIDHYKALKNNEKLQATYFLIGNMENKVGRYGKIVENYYPIFEMLQHLNTTKVDKDTINKMIAYAWDSVENTAGEITTRNFQYYYDYQVITAEYLIDNIDMAFKVWKEKPWAQHVDFDQFCEYILPYRVYDEPIQYFRKRFYNEFSWLQDSLKDKSDPKEACMVLNLYLAKKFVFCNKFDKCPMLGVNELYNFCGGICEHRYCMIANIMRSLGIPVGMEFSPQLVDWPVSHNWLSLLDKDGVTRPFNGGEPDVSFPDSILMPMYHKRSTKVYRMFFAEDVNHLVKKSEIGLIPGNLSMPNLVDVTSEYDFPKTTVKITPTIDMPDQCKFIYLCCFGNSYQLIPIDYSSIFWGKASFNNVGRKAVYIGAYYQNKKLIIASNPYYYPLNGGTEILNPDVNNLVRVKLTRKFPIDHHDSMLGFAKSMINAKLQASNNKDFENAVTLYTIDSCYYDYAEKNISNQKPFRYYRYLSSDTGKLRIADVDFMLPGSSHNFDKSKKYKIFGSITQDSLNIKSVLENAFDGNIATNLNAAAGSWVAIDYGQPVLIDKVRFCVRNDLDIVEVGDKYELLYFNYGWISLGTQIAKYNYLLYNSVPSNALLLLRDLTKGKSERIFIYRNGKQLFL